MTACGHCGTQLDIPPGADRTCPCCGTPHSRSSDLPPEKFPITVKIISGTTDAVVWSRVITLTDARVLAKIEIPSFADTEHYPVRVEVEYADGTTEVGGMQ